MRMHRQLLAAISPLVLLAGCSSGDETQNQPSNDMNAMATTADAATNPFAEDEQKMSQAMMSAVGSDVGDNWAKKMIEHHQGAIDMSQTVLDQNPKPDVAEMARMTIEKQRKDIEDIRKLLKNGAPDQKSADLYRPAMMDMQERMQAATGADASETFMRKMLEHHKGAVAMSDVALQNGVTGALRQQVQKTKDDNQKDANMTEAMLGGASHQQAMQESGAKSAEEAKAEPAPAEKAAAKVPPQNAPTPTPKAAPAPKTTADPKTSSSTCLPEHRAAGHC
jgi:uncharacterized protein (DUF305 family)